MKKIGILTLHRANNYGAVLQNYALLKAINNIGFSAETIDYVIPAIEKEYAPKLFLIKRNVYLMLKSNYYNLINKKSELKQYNKYKIFRKQFLNISSNSFNLSTISNSDYDLYIVGSDQIWNRDIIGSENEKVFSLNFTKKLKASYAASCGNLKYFIGYNNLKQFNYISVREQELFNYLKNHNIASNLVCDPTLLLLKEEWEDLIRNVEIDHTNYVYLYYIDSGRDEAAKIANDIGKKLNSKVYFSKKIDENTKQFGISELSDGPLDFLKEINNSNFVVVSSFHGVIFSILFEKDFIALLHENTGNRVGSLLDKLGLKDRIVNSYDDYKSKNFSPINYKLVKSKIAKWREYSLDELRKICSL